MGIDKADVRYGRFFHVTRWANVAQYRYIFHYDLPKSFEGEIIAAGFAKVTQYWFQDTIRRQVRFHYLQIFGAHYTSSGRAGRDGMVGSFYDVNAYTNARQPSKCILFYCGSEFAYFVG